MKRQTFPEGNKWEPIVGYSRAVRVGSYIHVAGTTATNEDGDIVGPGDPYQQTAYILKKIQTALRRAGADFKDVVCTRIYITNIDDWKEVGRAHREVFERIRPATTLVGVASLVVPEMLVEIEVVAILSENESEGPLK